VACAEGAAKATGCRLEWKEYMPGYENTLPNSVLIDLMVANLRSLGLTVQTQRKRNGRGSTDFGNVSRRVPGVEARIAITDRPDVAAKGLAMTAIDLLTDPEHLRQAKAVLQEDLTRPARRR
jgi:metal-dependent amidase/aminoacylase/carboxypeptidase family protein